MFLVAFWDIYAAEDKYLCLAVATKIPTHHILNGQDVAANQLHVAKSRPVVFKGDSDSSVAYR